MKFKTKKTYVFRVQDAYRATASRIVSWYMIVVNVSDQIVKLQQEQLLTKQQDIIRALFRNFYIHR